MVADPWCWGIPGGAIPVDEDGERMDAFASAMKETLEELGVDELPPWRSAGSVVFRDGDFTYTTFLLRVESQDGIEPVLTWESDDWQWSSERNLRDLDLHPGVTWVIDKARRRIFPR